MDNAVYLTLSRQLMLIDDMDVTANNLANQNTSGYQATHSLFTSYLVNDDGRGNMAFANNISTYRSLDSGGLTMTGNPLDIAIDGDGYIVVQAPQGQRYTRAGALKINTAGSLVTAQGYPVLDTGGQQIFFNPEDREITIGSAGNISINGSERGQLDIVAFDSPQSMVKEGDGLLSTGATPNPATNVRVVQGALESANVKPVVEMTHMIKVSQGADESAKVIQIVYDLESRSATAWTQQVA